MLLPSNGDQRRSGGPSLSPVAASAGSVHTPERLIQAGHQLIDDPACQRSARCRCQLAGAVKAEPFRPLVVFPSMRSVPTGRNASSQFRPGSGLRCNRHRGRFQGYFNPVPSGILRPIERAVCCCEQRGGHVRGAFSFGRRRRDAYAYRHRATAA